jgi:hypothetical protein
MALGTLGLALRAHGADRLAVPCGRCAGSTRRSPHTKKPPPSSGRPTTGTARQADPALIREAFRWSSSLGTDRQPGRAMTRAEALRWWQAGYQAGHQAAEHEQQAADRWDHLVASYRAQHAADQQARTDALLLEIIGVLARLLSSHDNGET